MKTIQGYTARNCDNCKKEYQADNRNLKRGWGLCCSKRCAAKQREMSKAGYSPLVVAANNIRRKNWHQGSDYGYGLDQMGNWEGIGAGMEFSDI